MNRDRPIDYFTREVIQQAFVAMGDEMFTILRRTAHSPLVFETLDFAVGATDADGEVICMGNGVTGFLGTLDVAVKDVIRKYAASGDLHPDDIVIMNTPYEGGGSHLSDATLVMPVFAGGTIIGYVVNKAHWSEIGGMEPGSVTTRSTEIYQEGLHIPNVKLCDAGRMNEAIIEIIRANVRLPDMTLGDLWAGIAALRMGRTRLLGLVEKYGRGAVTEAMAALLDYGEAMARKGLASLPRGTFEAVDWLDSDGMGNGPFEVRVKVTITDDAFEADFSGSHPTVPGSVNCTYVNLASRTRAVFRAVTTPGIPTNGGMYRPLRVVCPSGTVFSAEHPAAVSTYYESAVVALDLVWKALAPHVPERLTAGNLGSVCSITLSGPHPDTGEFWLLFGPYVGGWGAGCDHDGQSGQFSAANGETFNVPVELTEARYGLAVERYGLREEPGGFGTFNGGKGVVLDYRVTAERARLNTGFGRHRYPPWGVDGGQEGLCNYVMVRRRDGGEEVYGKETGITVERGDLVRLVTATGGGWGNPRRRDPTRVRDDVRNGLAGADTAASVHGVRIDEN